MSDNRSSLPTSRGGNRQGTSGHRSRRPDGESGRGSRNGRAPYRGKPNKSGARNDRRKGNRPNGNRQPRDPAREAAIEAFDTALSAFGALGVDDRIVKILGVDGIVAPTGVQAAVLPDAMAGRDVLGRARTGSGKTLAFGLPVLARLTGRRSRPNRPRALIMAPTRELAGQVATTIEPLARALGLGAVTVYGGAPYERQIRRLDRGVDVVIATPGRLNDLVDRGACMLDDVEVVVLDEADHLCDLGFFPVIDDLVGRTPDGGQRLLLSATLDGDVDTLVRRHLADPTVHEIDPDSGAVETMDHHVLVVSPKDKLDVTCDLVRTQSRSIVFTRTKRGASRLAEDLETAGIPAVDLHGDLSQRVRERNLDRFRSGRAHVVVATDVAARGIHVDDVGLVVHFDPPGESKAYLHRSGRTARAGASGAVVTVASPGQAREMTTLLHTAGVDAKNVDARAVARPMSATALGDAPAMAPLPARDKPKSHGAGGRGGRPAHRNGGRRNGQRSRNSGGQGSRR